MKSTDAVHAGVILACGAVMASAGQVLWRTPRESLDIDGVVGASLSLLGIAIVGLWVLALGLAIVAELLLRRGPSSAAALARRCTPALMRRLAAAMLGMNLLAVPTLAQAAPGGPDGSRAVPVAAGWPAISAGSPADAGAPEEAGTAEDVASDGAGAVSSGSPYWSPMTFSADPGPGPGDPAPEEPGPLPGTSGSDPSVSGGSASEDPPTVDLVPPAGTPPSGSTASPAPSGSPACPATPVPSAWEPARMPIDGGLLARPATRTVVGSAEVVVAPGDSLWSIVACYLGPLATATDVAGTWPVWYDANRTVIGDDPSLVMPGQVLTVPP